MANNTGDPETITTEISENILLALGNILTISSEDASDLSAVLSEETKRFKAEKV